MEHTALPWRRWIHLTLLLVQMSSPEAAASCRILRCNSEFVAATLDLSNTGGGGGAGGGGAGGAAGGGVGGGTSLSMGAVNWGYCSALRSYATCTRRMARSCRGDLAYHSAVQGIEDLLIQHRCPRAGPTAQPRPPPQGTLSDSCLYERSLLSQPDYLVCGVFGDPHVRTFRDDFHTCAVRGAWPLVDNDYLYIQATSSPTGGGATALTKITVIFKDRRHCVDQQLYQAQLDDVPAAFADGSVTSGARRGHRGLTVSSQSPGRHAEIRAAHIGTRLVVRQSGRTLGLTLRSPRAVVEAFGPEQDLQLCVWGCPPSQRLASPPRASPARAATARAQCGALLPVQDVYQQACVFDLISSGDLNSSAAALSALQDAAIMEPRTLHLPPAASAQTRPSPDAHLLLCVMAAMASLLTAAVM